MQTPIRLAPNPIVIRCTLGKIKKLIENAHKNPTAMGNKLIKTCRSERNVKKMSRITPIIDPVLMIDASVSAERAPASAKYTIAVVKISARGKIS